MRKTHGNREKKRRIHDDRVKVNDRKNPSKSKEESRQFEKRKKVLFDFIRKMEQMTSLFRKSVLGMHSKAMK